ncbi:hypothetical protein IAT38_001748 [Cryptococcus sp. DSM 104549]
MGANQSAGILDPTLASANTYTGAPVMGYLLTYVGKRSWFRPCVRTRVLIAPADTVVDLARQDPRRAVYLRHHVHQSIQGSYWKTPGVCYRPIAQQVAFCQDVAQEIARAMTTEYEEFRGYAHVHFLDEKEFLRAMMTGVQPDVSPEESAAMEKHIGEAFEKQP